MEGTFTHKRALVTGAGKGIGRAIAKALLACGAEVIALTRTQSDLDSLVQECPKMLTVCVDISNWEATESALKDIGRIDLLVNNAAVAILQPFLSVTQDAFDKVFDVNVKALLHVSQIIAKGMMSRGEGGAIVNISSQASQCALRDHTVYCASKGAVDMLTKMMALELGPHQVSDPSTEIQPYWSQYRRGRRGTVQVADKLDSLPQVPGIFLVSFDLAIGENDKIRVNSVNPTVVMTAMGRIGWSDPTKAAGMLSRIPLGRFAEVEDVVNTIIFLLSDKSAMINGVTLLVDGGFLSS